MKQKNSEHFQKPDDQSIFEGSLNGGHGDLHSTPTTTVVFELVCLIFLLTVLVQSLYVQADKTNFFLKKQVLLYHKRQKAQTQNDSLTKLVTKITMIIGIKGQETHFQSNTRGTSVH